MFSSSLHTGMKGDRQGDVDINQSSLVMLVLAVIVVVGSIASQRTRLGEPFYKRPAAIVLLVVLILVGGMLFYLSTRHGR